MTAKLLLLPSLLLVLFNVFSQNEIERSATPPTGDEISYVKYVQSH